MERLEFLTTTDASINPKPRERDRITPPGWISVLERLPDDKQTCIVWHPDMTNPCVARYIGAREFHDFFKNYTPVTHWMPLPAPPQPDGRLYQLHHEFGDGRTVMKAQAFIATPKQYTEWYIETNEAFPLPAGARWMACNEDSEHFVKTCAPKPEKECP